MKVQDAAPAEQLEALLRRVPFFRTLDHVDAARLVGVLEAVEAPVGTTLFVEGTEADALYLLERGQIEIMVRGPDGDRSVALLTGPAYFGELGLLLAYRTASARALTEASLWTLPRRKFEQLAQERAAIGLNTARSLAHLIDVRSRERVGAASRPEHDDQAPTPPTPAAQPRRNLSGIAAAVAVPAALWLVGPPAGMTVSGWHVSAIMLGAAIAWLSQAIPDFAVAVAMAAAWGLAGLAPIHLAFGGFANEAWVLAHCHTSRLTGEIPSPRMSLA